MSDAIIDTPYLGLQSRVEECSPNRTVKWLSEHTTHIG